MEKVEEDEIAGTSKVLLVSLNDLRSLLVLKMHKKFYD